MDKLFSKQIQLMTKLLAVLFFICSGLSAQTFFKSTDYSNLSSVPAGEGDVIEIYGEFPSGTGDIASGVHILGKTPNAAIIGGSLYSNVPAINADADTVYLKDLSIKSRIAIIADDHSMVSMENVVVRPHNDIESLANDYSSRDGGLISITDSELIAKDCEAINCANQDNKWIIDSGVFTWQGENFDVDAIHASGNSRFKLDVEYAKGRYGAGQHNRWRFGALNPYNNDIVGSKTNIKNTLPANYLAHNQNENGFVDITIADGRYLWSGIVIAGNYTATFFDSSFVSKSPDENEEMPAMIGIEAENNAIVSLYNVQVARADAKWFHGKYYLDENTTLHYDRDLYVSPNKTYGALYDSSNFPEEYGQGSHALESSDVYNLAAIPTWEFDNTKIVYMGDDCLNRLDVEQALKELSVNSLFRSDTEAYPDSSPFAGIPDYTTGGTYTAGSYFYLDGRVFVAVETFTAADSNAEHTANKFRALIGCKKFGSYYGTLIYEKNNGWVNVFTLSEWRGGYCRNRGNAVAFYNGNIIGKMRIIEHANTWTWFDKQKAGTKYWDKEGKNAYYRNIFGTKFGRNFDIERLEITQVGRSEDYVKKSAFAINLQTGVPDQNIRVKELVVNSDGLQEAVEIVGVDLVNHSLYLGHVEINGMMKDGKPDFGLFGFGEALIIVRGQDGLILNAANYEAYLNDLFHPDSFGQRVVTRTQIE